MPLHLYIRALEYILDLGYQLGVNKQDDKIQHNIKKNEIHIKIYNGKHLNIDVPAQTSGKTNDGNMAKIMFGDPTFFSETTGVDEELIVLTGQLLACCSTSEKIDFRKYLEASQKWFSIWSKKYKNIKNITPTIHRLIAHGHEFHEYLQISPGILSEQALEASNKIIKKSRESHTFKKSRQNIVENQINYLLTITWPPYNLFIQKYKQDKESDFSIDLNYFLE